MSEQKFSSNISGYQVFADSINKKKYNAFMKLPRFDRHTHYESAKRFRKAIKGGQVEL